MPGLMWTPRLESSSPDAREMRRTSTPLPVEGQGWDIDYACPLPRQRGGAVRDGRDAPGGWGLFADQRAELGGLTFKELTRTF